jgi:predicted AAA+ superfamily ATPase
VCPSIFRRSADYRAAGARQTGKTTFSQMVARAIVKNSGINVHTFDLECAASRAALATPEITFDSLSGLTIIDEIQRVP